MSAPKTRGQAVTAKCRECVHDPDAAGTWREQVSVCSSVDCALWRFRPLAANAPTWITSRNPADLPKGWASLAQDDAVRCLRGGTDANPDGDAVQPHSQTRSTEGVGMYHPAHAIAGITP